MECKNLENLLAGIKGHIVPLHIRELFEAHMKDCHTCQASLSRFLQIERILEKTVYGDTRRDNYLAFISHILDRRMHWETPEEAKKIEEERRKRILFRIILGFLIAGFIGALSALILGGLGIIGTRKFARQETVSVDSARADLRKNPSAAVQSAQYAGQAAPDSVRADSEPVQASTVSAQGNVQTKEEVAELKNITPQSIYKKIEGEDKASLLTEEKDSTKIKTLQAELSAYRDALSRTPRDQSLVKRSIEKYQEVIKERQRLGEPARVNDYYGLGYLHYSIREYPQTAIVTSEGIRMVHMGPTQYLHYLKAMSHYQMAVKASNPLPPDTSADENARVRGEALRAELDMEGRKKAQFELRRAVAEFNFLLTNPELEQTAREWILKCNDLMTKLH
jgi:hypothetical protein